MVKENLGYCGFHLLVLGGIHYKVEKCNNLKISGFSEQSIINFFSSVAILL